MSDQENCKDGQTLAASGLFDVGAEVVHRASGRKAVVCTLRFVCTNPSHTIGLHCISRNGADCNRKQVDVYDLSTDFGVTVEEVPGFLISPNDRGETRGTVTHDNPDEPETPNRFGLTDLLACVEPDITPIRAQLMALSQKYREGGEARIGLEMLNAVRALDEATGLALECLSGKPLPMMFEMRGIPKQAND